MRNRFIAEKLKRRWMVWGVGYFKPPGETLSRKPRAVASQQWDSGRVAVPRARDRGWGGLCDHHSQHRGQDRESPRCFGSHPPALRVCPMGMHVRRAGGWVQPLPSSPAEQQKERVSPFFPPFSLRACCLTKPSVTLLFFFSSSFCTKRSIITK